jgi:hypothetical protein
VFSYKLKDQFKYNNIRTVNYDDRKAKAFAKELLLNQGWNHFLIKLIQADGKWQFSGQLTSSQPAFFVNAGISARKAIITSYFN